MPPWSTADIPRLDGKAAIVTGGTGGIGYETALALAAAGARTILAGRNPDKGAHAVAEIQARHPKAQAKFELLDLNSLGSVELFARRWDGPIAILVNNAGIMGLPTRQTTQDGFEKQMGVNYLAHFALAARLKDRLNGARVVNVASLAHRRARLRLDDLMGEHSYQPRGTYGQSKLAMLMFALELHRRSGRHGWGIRSFAAHPGWARTDIIANGPVAADPGLKSMLMAAVFAALAQSAATGALPTLYAATAPEAQPGGYYGPTAFGETRGPPGPARIFPQATDLDAAARLWTMSEELTGVKF